ncbi:MAG: NADP oxidoreductase [Candidatus Kryptoniota bacterium]
MKKVRFATVWLDGCSGCHMSFLDTDEKLLELADKVDVVFSPLVDNKIFPDKVDVTLVEGSVSSDEDLKKIKHIRSRTKLLVALGDCAVTGNIPSMRNQFGVNAVLRRAYVENVTVGGKIPDVDLPVLLPEVRPVHEVVKVDLYLPGCPPPADAIYYLLTELLAGRTPNLEQQTRFGR